MPRPSLHPVLAIALVVLLLAPAAAHAEPSPTREAAEETVEFLLPLLVGDVDTSRARCAPTPAIAGSWTCSVRWSVRTDPWTVTRCFNPSVLDGVEEIELDDARTTCRAISHARRGR